MKKVVLFALVMIFSLQMALASITVENQEKANSIIAELGNPAIFDLTFNNTGPADNIQIYSLVGVQLLPNETFNVPTGDKTIEVKAYASDRVRRNRGNINFEYEIMSNLTGQVITGNMLRIRLVDFSEALEFGQSSLYLGEKMANLTIRNLENDKLENAEIKFRSAFFERSENVSIDPLETKSFYIDIDDNAQTRALLAGDYVITGELMVNGKSKAIIEGVLNYAEKEQITTKETGSGWIVASGRIEKKNDGNTKTPVQITYKRDILTRLFTTYSAEPDTVERRGLVVYYTWNDELSPGETFAVTSRTNYIFPLLLVILVVVVALLVRMYTRTAVIIKKNVSYVKTKGGQFALKVRVRVKARKNVERLELSDILPGSTKLYEGFGTVPHKMDQSSRKLVWNFNMLRAGEERVVTYIIYSNVRIVGNFSLPAAHASYERNGKREQVFSNRTYFISEQISRN